MKKLLVKNIGLLATPEGKSAHRGEEQGKIKFLKDAWVLIEDGVIASVGTGAVPACEGAEVVDAEGHLVTPGLVDARSNREVFNAVFVSPFLVSACNEVLETCRVG